MADNKEVDNAPAETTALLAEPTTSTQTTTTVLSETSTNQPKEETATELKEEIQTNKEPAKPEAGQSKADAEEPTTHEAIAKRYGTSFIETEKLSHAKIKQVYGTGFGKRKSTDMTHKEIAELLGGKANRPEAQVDEITKKNIETKMQLHVVRMISTPLLENKMDDFLKYVEETERPILEDEMKKGHIVCWRRSTNKEEKMTYTHEVYASPTVERLPPLQIKDTQLNEAKKLFVDETTRKPLIQIWGDDVNIAEDEKVWAPDNIQVISDFKPHLVSANSLV